MFSLILPKRSGDARRKAFQLRTGTFLVFSSVRASNSGAQNFLVIHNERVPFYHRRVILRLKC
jgi:hypothetical protein